MPGVHTRDSVAYQLLSLGYSAREAADVVSGRISKRALDRARWMLVVGLGQQAAADYLDKEYTRVSAVHDARASQARLERRSPASSRFDSLIDQYANLHRVEAAIVRAIIATESAFDPRARSRAGAIGLMQLMPATARELGVDPFEPAQNIEGGVRYFSELLKMFGGVELALVAYNGGPGFAQRYARGETALYGETRDYVRRVLSRLQTAR
jgi:soluble lytic murein transglycosylase-like protein